MSKINFDEIDDVQDYTPVPEDKYLCRLIGAEEGTTEDGKEKWNLKLGILQGEYQGRFIFDNLFFTEKALPRLKFICTQLGLELTGEVELEPKMLEDRRCHVTVSVEEYEDHLGKTKKRNVVQYKGYEAVDGESQEDNKPPF